MTETVAASQRPEGEDQTGQPSAKVQTALYRIAETAGAAEDMPSFYAAIHEIVRELMYADNFYIALYDERRGLLNYPYYRDEIDLDVPDPAVWDPIGTGQAAGVTGYLLRRGMPVLLSRDDYQRLVERGEVEAVGIPGTDWMGAPLLADGLTVGAVVVQSYREDRRHTATDLELLTFVARHIATALTRARAIEETRQRNAELAVINEIGEGLAKQLDFTAIIDLVGERIGEVFASNSVSIALYDADTNLLSFPYSMDRGTRLPDDSYELGPGLTSEIIRTESRCGWGRSPSSGATTWCWSGASRATRSGASRGSASRSLPANVSWGSSPWSAPRHTRSARPMSASCRRSPPAWGLPSRTRGSSTRRSAS